MLHTEENISSKRENINSTIINSMVRYFFSLNFNHSLEAGPLGDRVIGKVVNLK